MEKLSELWSRKVAWSKWSLGVTVAGFVVFLGSFALLRFDDAAFRSVVAAYLAYRLGTAFLSVFRQINPDPPEVTVSDAPSAAS